MRSGSSPRRRAVAALTALLAAAVAIPAGAQGAAASCEKPVYLTFDTGHMGIAPLVAEVLKRQRQSAHGGTQRAHPSTAKN